MQADLIIPQSRSGWCALLPVALTGFATPRAVATPPPTDREIDAAVTQRQRGVVAVRNHLVVMPEPWDWLGIYSGLAPSSLAGKTDRELSEDVRSQLFWNPIVDADKVAVTVVDGVVTLTGSVEDQPQSKAAERCAREAGAERVKNLLKVSSS
jgi:osmotically-inducible protein OsmY